MVNPPAPDRRLARVPTHLAGVRLDRFLADCFPQYSRRQLTLAVKAGLVRINGRVARPGTRLEPGDELALPRWSQVLKGLELERRATREVGRAPTQIVELHRDDELLVVSKPPHVPVHGGAGQRGVQTLLDRLREDVLAGFNLVHRLDRDTSGVIALVRGEAHRRAILERFLDPEGGIEKVYEAIVSGHPEPAEGLVDLPLAPPAQGGRARVSTEEGKPALTRYRTIESFVRAARLELRPKTGRTHQIRAHLKAIGCPLLVDPLYGGRRGWRIPDPRGRHDVHLQRTPLHARRLTLPHPRTGESMTFEAAVPDDMKYVLEILRIAAARGRKRGGLPPV